MNLVGGSDSGATVHRVCTPTGVLTSDPVSRSGVRLVTLGAVVGATLRWGVFTVSPHTQFPWFTLVVNLVGCALLGWFTTRPLADTDIQLAMTVGFCSGLTTFSTFAVELAILRSEAPGIMWTYLVTSIVGGTTAYLATRTVRAAP